MPPSTIRPLFEALLLGSVLAAAALAGAALYHWLVPDAPQLAGDALFANGSPAIVFLMVTLWAPLFETLAAQVLPIALCGAARHRSPFGSVPARCCSR